MMMDNIDPKKPGEEEPLDEHHDEEYDVGPTEEEESTEHDLEFEEHEEEPEQEPKSSGIMSKLPQLGGIGAKLQPLVGNLPIKKISLISFIVIILIIAGIFTMRSYHTTKLRLQAATAIISLSSSMQDIQQYLGLPVTVTKPMEGTVDDTAQNAQLTFGVQGSKSAGTVSVSLVNGQITNLRLQTPDGQQHDVLQDEAAYKSAQAAKAALAQKEAAIEGNFNNAVTALRNKNYQAAITGFQQSVIDNYQVTKSYEYLGFSYSQTNQFQQCVTFYQKYVQLQTDDSEAYYQIAYCQLQMYQTTDALINLDKSCKLGYAMACSAAMQIRDQLNQKPANNAEQTLSPQQSIDQQKQMQQQLQNDNTQQLLNGESVTTPQGSATPTVPSTPSTMPMPGSAPQEAMPSQPSTMPTPGSAPQEAMPSQPSTMPAPGSAPQGVMPSQPSTMPAPASTPQSMPSQPGTTSTPSSAPQQMMNNQSTVAPQGSAPQQMMQNDISHVPGQSSEKFM